MLKRFFVAAILVLLLMSSQIVAAADIDWSQAPQIGSKAELARYVENERCKGNNIFNVIFINGLRVDTVEDFGNVAPCLWCNIKQVWYRDDGIEGWTYEIKEFPGTHVANAYLAHLNGNDSYFNQLTPEETQLYYEAIPIVNEANKYPSQIAKELYIHEVICDLVDYASPTKNKTAIGALIDKKTDCQGYADAFYMLGRMCGLNVGRIGGGGHEWNTIEFVNGTVYFVDLVGDDDCFDFGENIGKVRGYIYFNAPEEIIAVNHTWDRAILPNLQKTIDKHYSYLSLSGLAYVNNLQDGYNLIANKLSTENRKLFSVMTPINEKQGNYSGKAISMYSLDFGNYFFCTARVR